MLTARRVGTLVCLLVLLPAFAAQGAVITFRPLDPALEGEYTNVGAGHQRVADSFSVAQAFALTSLTWYGRYDSVVAETPVDFVIRLYATDPATGGPANAALMELNGAFAAGATGNTYTLPAGLGGGVVPWLGYSTGLPGWVIGPGTYWLSILEADVATPSVGFTQWLWGDTATNGPVALRNDDGVAWNISNNNSHHAFMLEGRAVPEPGALLLLATGLLGLAARKRTR